MSKEAFAELAKTIGVEGLAAMGYKLDGSKTSSFEDGLREGVASTMGRESMPLQQSPLVEGEAIIKGLRARIGEGVDITRAHVLQYVKSIYGTRMDLVEAACTVAKRQRLALAGAGTITEANALHDPDTGEFTSQRAIVAKKKGSFSLGGYGVGKSKSRVGKRGAKMGKGKDGRVRALINWVATSRPCGRDARAKGKDIKCSTGKRGGAMEAVERTEYVLESAEPQGRWVKRDATELAALRR